MNVVNHYFPLQDAPQAYASRPALVCQNLIKQSPLYSEIPAELKAKIGGDVYRGELERVIRTTAGPGPQVVNNADLLDDDGNLLQ